ncbi:hypothetical protein TI04_07600 [Achromatium sp. WMS2]|nr:hypothetical protein TI04_07600 [Achromatium sp. WMS2]
MYQSRIQHYSIDNCNGNKECYLKENCELLPKIILYNATLFQASELTESRSSVRILAFEVELQ